MIRKTIITLLLAAMSTGIIKASGEIDTVYVANNPHSVTVISKGNSRRVEINGREGIFRYESSVTDTSNIAAGIDEPDILMPFIKTASKKKRGSYIDYFCDLYGGAVIGTDAEQGFKHAGWEIGMLNLVKGGIALSSSTELSVGAGWVYRRLPIGGGMMPDADHGNLYLKPIAEGFHNVSSSISSFSLQVPVLLYQNIYNNLGIEIGGVANLNTYTMAKTSWHSDQNKHKTVFKGLHQRMLTVDAIARIGLRGVIALYVRYSPMSAFKLQHGPQYDSVSLGLSIGF